MFARIGIFTAALLLVANTACQSTKSQKSKDESYSFSSFESDSYGKKLKGSKTKISRKDKSRAIVKKKSSTKDSDSFSLYSEKKLDKKLVREGNQDRYASTFD